MEKWESSNTRLPLLLLRREIEKDAHGRVVDTRQLLHSFELGGLSKVGRIRLLEIPMTDSFTVSMLTTYTTSSIYAKSCKVSEGMHKRDSCSIQPFLGRQYSDCVHRRASSL